MLLRRTAATRSSATAARIIGSTSRTTTAQPVTTSSARAAPRVERERRSPTVAETRSPGQRRATSSGRRPRSAAGQRAGRPAHRSSCRGRQGGRGAPSASAGHRPVPVGDPPAAPAPPRSRRDARPRRPARAPPTTRARRPRSPGRRAAAARRRSRQAQPARPLLPRRVARRHASILADPARAATVGLSPPRLGVLRPLTSGGAARGWRRHPPTRPKEHGHDRRPPLVPDPAAGRPLERHHPWRAILAWLACSSSRWASPMTRAHASRRRTPTTASGESGRADAMVAGRRASTPPDAENVLITRAAGPTSDATAAEAAARRDDALSRMAAVDGVEPCRRPQWNPDRSALLIARAGWRPSLEDPAAAGGRDRRGRSGTTRTSTIRAGRRPHDRRRDQRRGSPTTCRPPRGSACRSRCCSCCWPSVR